MPGCPKPERARKAITTRLREAIHRIEAVLPKLGAHLNQPIITGTNRRYEPVKHLTWTL